MQFSPGLLHCCCEAFKILDFHEATPRHSNGFLILDNSSCLCRGLPNIVIFKSKAFHLVRSYLIVACFEFLPSVLLIFCFVSMLHVVCKHNRAAHSLAKQLRFNQQVFFKPQEKSAVIMMGIVIGLFLSCYAIYFRCSILYTFRNPCNDGKFKIPILVLNSAVNPLAYSFFKRDINKEIKRRICCAKLT